MGFQQGLSGLNVAAKSLDVIGNNVANASTVGYKASRAEFSNIYAATLSGAGTSNTGIGVVLSSVAQQFTQGNISTTENPMDLAINGQGFFQVTDGLNPRLYTRNGQFKLDRAGNIVNNDGLKLMGYPADGTGVIQPGIAQPLQLPTGGIDPAVTSSIKLQFNLDSRLAQTGAGTGMILNDPTTYNNATSLSVYDAKGQEIALTLYFQKGATAATGETEWHVYATANGTSLLAASDASAITPDADGNPDKPWTTLIFPKTGGLPITPDPTADPAALLNMDIPPSTNSVGAAALDIAGISVNLLSITENGSAFSVSEVLQDGYAPGQLSGILIENNGIVTARYSNGQTKPAGQIELANFRNVQGLQPLGGNVWASTFASGDPVLGVPSVGNFGGLQAGALEDSNTDLTVELVNMITAQRVYQANAQTIRTQDQVLQTITNLR
ncbi:flagellar hook protein FlgE [Inhella gelatinilytica]|uniref:Flagellar hook protein FlgE n=1 Tax=Inhella gelatinilytica TaxID=2795030 RepID=A0A931IX64_9BURK|nr:flagellar hook protein FlgE [Inhella gelatinilytica]MBH9553542.1 flagellar hook protein FlgE [Inhella gelatinilytica]